MENLDLDINNYSIKDIEAFFKLNPKNKYTEADIELKEYEIREQLLKSGHINKRFKRDLIEFLNKAKNLLIHVKCNNSKNIPTSIPKNYRLDLIDSPLLNELPPRTDELINKPTTQYINVLSDEYFPGNMNPLKTRIITKCLNIDTRFRDDIYKTKSSDFTFNLPMKFNKVVSMQLASLELPVTFYGISKALGNYFLILNIDYNYLDPSNNSPQTLNTVITIADGNYNSNDLISTINSQLSPTNTDNTLQNPSNPSSYIQLSMDLTINGSGSGIITIQTTENTILSITNITIDFTTDIDGIPDNLPLNTKLGWNLGFHKPKYTGYILYTGETVIEPSLTRYLYLVVDDFVNNSVNNHFISVFSKSILSPNILARIAIQGSYFSIIMQNDFKVVSEPRKYFGPVDIQKLRIQLIDEYGRILDMNNSDFSFCINLKMIYDL
jgi:hypothetical protein